MKLLTLYKEILEYLDEHGPVNTFKFSRDLKIDRIELIKIIKELKDKGLVEFKYGIVRFLKIANKSLSRQQDRTFALKVLGDVNPAHCFYLCNGAIQKNLEELVKALENIDDDIYKYHANSEKNDFSNWIKDVIGDINLASNLKMENRIEVINILKARIKYLRDIVTFSNFETKIKTI